MRRLLSFECEGAALGASLDEAAGATGVLMVTGGSQTRIGSHRMYERLAHDLAAAGYPSFRFDRRGVGDSAGTDPGYRGSGPDVAAAATAFRRHCPRVERLIGFGLCDGATALALFGADAGLSGLILVNPWLVEAESGAPPPAAIRRHYVDRLMSLEGWKKIFTGSISYRKLFKGVAKASSTKASDLAELVADSLSLPAQLVLAEGDATAIAAEHELKRFTSKGLSLGVQKISTDSHTFAKNGDARLLTEAVLNALGRFQPERSSPTAASRSIR